MLSTPVAFTGAFPSVLHLSLTTEHGPVSQQEECPIHLSISSHAFQSTFFSKTLLEK